MGEIIGETIGETIRVMIASERGRDILHLYCSRQVECGGVKRLTTAWTAHSTAASVIAIPVANEPIVADFQIMVCDESAAIQIPTPHSAPVNDTRNTLASAPLTATTAPYTVRRGWN